MMLHIPGKTDHGIVTEQLTEYVDLFPTLTEAAGLDPLPLCPLNSTDIALCREGDSLMPLVEDPKSQHWKKRVFSQYPRLDRHGPVMGYSLRTGRYRYTEWVGFDHKAYKPMWDQVRGVELYDHGKDAEENYNVYKDPAYKVTVQGLSKMLHLGWRV